MFAPFQHSVGGTVWRVPSLYILGKEGWSRTWFIKKSFADSKNCGGSFFVFFKHRKRQEIAARSLNTKQSG